MQIFHSLFMQKKSFHYVGIKEDYRGIPFLLKVLQTIAAFLFGSHKTEFQPLAVCSILLSTAVVSICRAMPFGQFRIGNSKKDVFSVTLPTKFIMKLEVHGLQFASFSFIFSI